MPAVHTADDVAQELRRRLPGLPIKKLHKLLYYCQGYHLAATGERLFSDPISAWDMGPVVGTLWHRERVGELLESGLPFDEGQLNSIGFVVFR